MQKILTAGVAIGNAASLAIVWYPRPDTNMKGIRIYPDTDSAWIMGFVECQNCISSRIMTSIFVSSRLLNSGWW